MRLKYYLPAILLCVLFHIAQATTDDPTDNARYGYIENKGQIHDQNGKARNDIRFMYYDDQFKLTLRNTGFSYEFVRTGYLQPNNTESGTPREIEDDDEVEYTVQYSVNRVDIDFVKPNPGMEVISEGQSPFYRNYFNQYTGYKGIRRLHSFAKVTYKNIYPGIDLVFSSETEADGKIYPKYEFVVHGNGKIADIALNYKGDFQFSIVEDGALKLNTDLGYVNETQPVILFSDRASEKGKFIRHGSIISFGNVKRRSAETITIDPTIQWGTYWGGTQKDLTDEIAVDLDQNIYVTGRTRSSSSIATSGSYQQVLGGGVDIPLLKWDPSGNLIYATYYGGSEGEIAFCITIDSYNQPWIGGHTLSTSGIATPGAMQASFVGPAFDGVLAKWSSDGDLLYGTYFGDSGKDELQNIWADTDGSIYCSGYSESLSGIIYSPCFQCTGSATGAIILMKFDNNGNQIWATYCGGIDRDRGHGITVSGNNVYQLSTVESITGITYGNPGGNAFKTTNSGQNEVLLGRWNKYTGTPYWITFYGGSGHERARDIRCDRDGYIYFTGLSESETGLATPGAWKESFVFANGNRDGYVAKFDSNCNRIWGTYFGGNQTDVPRSLRVLQEGAPIYVGGYTASDSFFTTSGAYDTINKKSNDAFWVKFNWDGTLLQYATYFGGLKAESVTEGGWYGPSMDLDANNNLYLSSGTNSSDGIALGSSFKDTLASPAQYDFFLAKFSDPCPDGFEPNNEINLATELKFRNNNVLTHDAPIQVKYDQDYYSFKMPAGMNNLHLTLTSLPFDCNLYLYDSTQNQIGASLNSGITSETVILNNTYTGKYYASVKSPTEEFGSVCYKLDVFTSAPSRNSNESALGTISVYPNPADYSTSLQFDCRYHGFYHIDICDLQGRILIPMREELEACSQTLLLPVEMLSTGTYLVKVSGDGVNDVVKLIVQK